MRRGLLAVVTSVALLAPAAAAHASECAEQLSGSSFATASASASRSAPVAHIAL